MYETREVGKMRIPNNLYTSTCDGFSLF